MLIGHRIRQFTFAAAWLLLAGVAPALAVDGDALLTARCANCHNLTGPAASTVAEIRARKGPDLFYAGNKYRAEWLTSWLKKPQRIRPAGAFYGHHIKATGQWDEVDTASLMAHPSLSGAEAQAVTQALMKKTPKSALLEGISIQPVRLSLTMGDMMFDKFKGCIACHQSGKDYGGFSGPELYTAATRLQPEFLYSYMRSPQAWDPKIWMPNANLGAGYLNKLIAYLDMIAKLEAKQ